MGLSWFNHSFTMKFLTMKSPIQLLLIFCLFSYIVPLAAQSEEPRSISRVDYMKVAPNHIDDYLAVEKVWKKIHQKNIDDCKYQYWEVQEVISPAGDQYSYNYITRISFVNPEQYSAFLEGGVTPKGVDRLLTKDEMKVYNKTVDARTLVKTEVWQLMDERLEEEDDQDPSMYSKFNFFIINEGYTADNFVEVQSIWSPIHEARIADDKLEAWSVMRKLMPSGTHFDERYATIDRYKSMTDLMLDDPSRYFDMLGNNADEVFEKTDAGANLARQEIRKKVMSSDRNTGL